MHVLAASVMTLMMMMNELPLTRHIVLGLQGHVTVIVGSRSSQCSETLISQSSCKTGQKTQFSV